MVFSKYMSGVWLLDHMVALFLSFKGTSILFTIVAVPTCLPRNGVGLFFFLHTLSSIYCFWIFLIMIVLTSVKWWYLTVLLIWIYLIICDVQHFFMCFSAICMSSLEKCLDFLPIFWLSCFLKMYFFIEG